MLDCTKVRLGYNPLVDGHLLCCRLAGLIMHDKSKYYYNFNCMVISGRIGKGGIVDGERGTSESTRDWMRLCKYKQYYICSVIVR